VELAELMGNIRKFLLYGSADGFLPITYNVYRHPIFLMFWMSLAMLSLFAVWRFGRAGCVGLLVA